METPLPAHKRAAILVRVAGALRRRGRRGCPDDLRGGREAAQGRPRRGRAGDVDLHDGRGRGAHARRRDRADGRLAGRRGQARVHAAPPDRGRRRDLAVQLPAQPRRPQDRAGARRRLRRRPQAGAADAALGAAPRGARARGRAAARLAQRPRRPVVRDRRRPRRGRAGEAITFTGSGGSAGSIARARAEEAGRPRARQRDAGRSSRPTPTSRTRPTRLAANAFSFAGQSCISVQRIYVAAERLDGFMERSCRRSRRSWSATRPTRTPTWGR